MAADDSVDPELAELRARRLEQLVRQRSAAEAADRAPPVPEDLTSASYAEFLRRNPHAVVDVWAPWCGPCRTMAPILEGLARELSPSVRFGKLNADEEPAIAGGWNVQAIPTLLLFDGGRLVDRVVGALPAAPLRERLRRVFRLS